MNNLSSPSDWLIPKLIGVQIPLICKIFFDLELTGVI